MVGTDVRRDGKPPAGRDRTVNARNTIIVHQIADAINFHTGVTRSVVSNTFVRNTGDDGLAMWSEKTNNANNVFDHNIVQSPVLANGIGIYGGQDITVSNNLVTDPVREGSGIHLGARFGAEAFAGNNAIMFVTDFPVKDL